LPLQPAVNAGPSRKKVPVAAVRLEQVGSAGNMADNIVRICGKQAATAEISYYYVICTIAFIFVKAYCKNPNAVIAVN